MNQKEADLSTLAGAVGLIHRYDYSGNLHKWEYGAGYASIYIYSHL